MTRPVLVLLHGWGFSAQVWDRLRECLPGVEVYAPDLPGHGRETDRILPGEVDAMAAEVLEHLPAAAHAPLWVGWSMGGLVALAAAARHPNSAGVVLVGSTPRFRAAADWPHALAPAELENFRAELGGVRDRVNRRLAMLCARGGRVESAAGNPARALRRQLEEAPASTQGLVQGLDLLDQGDLRQVWQDAPGIAAAWLAEADTLVPVAVAGELRMLRPDAEIREVPGGHADWIHEPGPLAAFLLECAGYSRASRG